MPELNKEFIESYKGYIDSTVDGLIDHYWDMALDIHAHPEVAFTEVRTHDVCVADLEAAGFQVSSECKGAPTAFVAAFENGEGPTIGIFAELDALPIGHACGHNLITTSALLSGVAAKRAMERFGITGTLKVYGCPAEEGGGGKIFMLDEGLFEGLDIALLMHPTSATSRIEAECCASARVVLTFKGRAAQPKTHPEDGINAMDAMTLARMGIALHRYKVPGDTRINDVVTEMSKIPNSVPELAIHTVAVSSLSLKHLDETIEMVKRCAEGAAHATTCSLEVEVNRGYLGRVRNETIGNVMREELIAVGEPMLEGFHIDMGGEDFGNVSRVLPGNMMYVTIHPEKKISGHTPLFREKAASEDGRHCLYVSGKALARAALVFMQDEELIAQAKAELSERLAAEVDG